MLSCRIPFLTKYILEPFFKELHLKKKILIDEILRHYGNLPLINGFMNIINSNHEFNVKLIVLEIEK
jgi:hypothetical protein